MKVKEYAQQRGVSNQAIYQRLKGLKKKTGKPLSAYIEPKSNELTGEAVEILNKLYDDKQQVKQIPVKTDDDKIKELNQTIEKLEIENKSLHEQIDSADKQQKQLQAVIEDLRNDKRILQNDKQILQNDKQFLQSMLDGMTRQPKKGFIRRLFSGREDQTIQGSVEGKETDKREAETTDK